MATIVTGASGLIGKALCAQWPATALRFCKTLHGINQWNEERIACPALEGSEAVIHLAGASIAGGLWTEKRKAELVRSRVQATRLLVRHILRLKNPPPLFIQASAIGYYGNSLDAVVDESAPCGRGFLATLCRDWEEASKPLEAAGIRVVCLRFGNVLSLQGGLLPSLLHCKINFSWGDPQQWLSWVGIEDAVKTILHARQLKGTFNVCANPIQSAEFAQCLHRAFQTKCTLHLPNWLLRRLPGNMGEEIFFSSCRATSRRLVDAGFTFRHRTVQSWLAAHLPKAPASLKG